MDPVAGDVNHHHDLEKEHEARVEVAKSCQQAHSGTSVCKHVKHCTKFAT